MTTSSTADVDAPAAAGETDPKRRPRLAWVWEVFLITAFTAFGPAMALVNNPESPTVGTTVLVISVLVLVGSGVRLVLIKLGLDGQASAYSIGLFALAALNLGNLVQGFPFGRFGLLAVSVLAAWLIYRLSRLRVVELVVSWACLALAMAPIATAATNLELGAPEEVPIGDEFEVPAFTSRPDVVLVVADGYASNDVLSGLYNHDNHSFADSLSATGMDLIDGINSNYARTKLSIPSLLDMGYLPLGTPVTNAFEAQLLTILGGDNRLADTMIENGYRTVYLESGWFGTQCSNKVDVCIGSAWPDETLYDIVHRSILRDLPGFETGMSFARGAQHTLASLRPTLEAYLTDGQPDFVYVHLLAPHPPLFLDANCEFRPSASLSGFAIGHPGMSESNLEARRDAYVEQIECVNHHLAEAAGIVDDARAVGLFFGDHGSDLNYQLYTHSDNWTDAERAERFGVMFAAHHPGCEYTSVLTLVNVGRRLVECLSGVEVPVLPDRYFDLDKHGDKTPVVIELDPPKLSQ